MADKKGNGIILRFIDLKGKTFGRLTVIERAENIGKYTAWLCECSCEEHNKVVVLGMRLKNKSTQSCGCLKIERIKEANTKHGYCRKREYNSWQAMIGRCLYPSNKSFKDYGGRGITVCDRWLHSFENFLKDMGKRLYGTELDRINVNGNYEPGNCRWVTKIENNNNKRKDIGKGEVHK